MKPIISVAIVLLLHISVAGAIDFGHLQNYVDTYNNKIGNAPPVLKGMIGSENVDFNITLNNSSKLRWGIVVKDAVIAGSTYGGLQNSTIDVYATEDSINRLLDSEDPVAAYRDAERAGQMKLDGKTFTAKIKITTGLSAGDLIKPFLKSLRTKQNLTLAASAALG